MADVTIPSYPLSLPVSYRNFDLGGGGSGVFKCSVTADPIEVVVAYFQLQLGPPDYRDESEAAMWCFPAPEGSLYGGQMLEVRPAREDGSLEAEPGNGLRTAIYVSWAVFPGPCDPAQAC